MTGTGWFYNNVHAVICIAYHFPVLRQPFTSVYNPRRKVRQVNIPVSCFYPRLIFSIKPGNRACFAAGEGIVQHRKMNAYLLGAEWVRLFVAAHAIVNHMDLFLINHNIAKITGCFYTGFD